MSFEPLLKSSKGYSKPIEKKEYQHMMILKHRLLEQKMKFVGNRSIFIVLVLFVFYFPGYGQEIPVTTVVREGVFMLVSGNLSIVIDGNTGSRVISLKLDDEEILGSKREHPKYYGSTLWLSPEGKWHRQSVLDASAYTTEFFNGKQLH